MAPCNQPPGPPPSLDRLFTQRIDGSQGTVTRHLGSFSARLPGSARGKRLSSSLGVPDRLPSRQASRPISRDDTRWHPRPFSPRGPQPEVETLRPEALKGTALPSHGEEKSGTPAEIVAATRRELSAPKTAPVATKKFRPKAADITGAPWPEDIAGHEEGFPASIADHRAAWRIKAEIPSVKEFPHRRCLAWSPNDPDKPPLYIYNPLNHSVDKYTVNEFGERERHKTDRHSSHFEASIRDSVMYNRRLGVGEYIDQTRHTAERWNPLYHEGINNHERLFYRKSGATTNFVDVMIRQGYQIGKAGR